MRRLGLPAIEMLRHFEDDLFDESVYRYMINNMDKVVADLILSGVFSLNEIDLPLESYYVEKTVLVEIEGNVPLNKVLFFYDEKYKLYRRLYYDNIKKTFYYTYIEKRYKIPS